jgi:replicative DNA helicase
MSGEENEIVESQTEDTASKSVFDGFFQMAIIKLALTEDFFCAQLVKYLGDSKDLNNYIIFDTETMHIVFKKLVDYYLQYGSRPAMPQMRQLIYQEPDRIKGQKGTVSKDELMKTFDTIIGLKIGDEKYYRDNVGAYVRQIKFLTSQKKVKEIFKKNPELAPAKMQEFLDDIQKVNFEKEDVVYLADVTKMMEESAQSLSQTLPTGIIELDNDLHGGLPRETLVTILAGTNVGKSMFLGSIGSQVLKAKDENGNNLGLKVLHIPFEGMRTEAPMRYLACLAEVEYGKIINNALNEEEKKRINTAIDLYSSRLMIKNMLQFNVTIEKVYAELREIYKEFKFDMLMVDYGQLLGTQVKTEGHRFTMAVVFRALAAMAREFNCTVISPVQATREGQKDQNESFGARPKDKLPILRSGDISEAFEIARVSGIILSLNMTDEERNEKKIRIFLEKQRHGMKGKQYGLITDYAKCNLITGKFYNPVSNLVIGGNAESSAASHTETFSIELLMAKNQSVEQNARAEKLYNLTLVVADLEEKIKKKHDEMLEEKEVNPLEVEDVNGMYQKLSKEYFDLTENLNIEKRDFLSLFKLAYTHATVNHLEAVETSLKELKNIKANEERITELKKHKEVFKLGLNLLNEEIDAQKV